MILGIVASSISKSTAGVNITSYVFNGDTDSYLGDDATTPTMLDDIVNQTFVIRVKMTSSGVQHGILGMHNTVNGVKLEVDSDDNKADGDLRDTGASAFVNGVIANDNAWHNLFFFYDGSEVGLYEDDSEITSPIDADFTARTDGRALAVGGAVIGGGTPGYLVGEISDLQFYNKRLSVQEIADLNIDLTDTATGLIANFAGSKTATTWTDEVSGFELTNQGGVEPVYEGNAYVERDAADPYDEGNSIGSSWDVSNDVTVTSDGTTSTDGDYSIKIVSDVTGACRAEYDFPIEDGEDYDVTIWAKSTVGSNNRIYAWTGFVTSPSEGITNTSWTEYTYSVTASGTAGKIRVYSSTSSGVLGDTIHIDKIFIVKTS